MPVTFIEDEATIAPPKPGRNKITFLDEEEPAALPQEEPAQPLPETALNQLKRGFLDLAAKPAQFIANTQQAAIDLAGQAPVIGPAWKGALEMLPAPARTVAPFMQDIAERRAEMSPVDPRNKITSTVAGAVPQAIGMMATGGAAGVPAVLALGGMMGGQQGYETADEIGVTSPLGKMATAAAFAGAEAGIESMGGIGGKQVVGSIGKRFLHGATSETLEEPATGFLQDAVTRIAATDTGNGQTATGYDLSQLSPTDPRYWEKRGLETLGGAAGGTIFAGVQALGDMAQPQQAPAPRGNVPSEARQGTEPQGPDEIDAAMQEIANQQVEGQQVPGPVGTSVETGESVVPDLSNLEPPVQPPESVIPVVGSNQYEYAGLDAAGNEISGTIQANSQDEAVSAIRAAGNYPTSIKQAQAPLQRDAGLVEITNIDDIIANGGGTVQVSSGGRAVNYKQFGITVDGDTAEVAFVELDPSERGRGIGQEAYVALGNQLAKRGITLRSSKAQYRDGNRLWKKLADKGMARQIGQGAFEFIPPPSVQVAEQVEAIAPGAGQLGAEISQATLAAVDAANKLLQETEQLAPTPPSEPSPKGDTAAVFPAAPNAAPAQEPTASETLPIKHIENLFSLPAMSKISDQQKAEAESSIAALAGLNPADLQFVRSGNSKVFRDKVTGDFIKIAAAPSEEALDALIAQVDAVNAVASKFAIAPEVKVIMRGDGGVFLMRQKPAGVEGASIKNRTKEDMALFQTLKDQNPLSTEAVRAFRVETDQSLKNMGLVLGEDGMVRAYAFDFDGFEQGTNPDVISRESLMLKHLKAMEGVPLSAFSQATREAIINGNTPQSATQDEAPNPFPVTPGYKPGVGVIPKLGRFQDEGDEYVLTAGSKEEIADWKDKNKASIKRNVGPAVKTWDNRWQASILVGSGEPRPRGTTPEEQPAPTETISEPAVVLPAAPTAAPAQVTPSPVAGAAPTLQGAATIPEASTRDYEPGSEDPKGIPLQTPEEQPSTEERPGGIRNMPQTFKSTPDQKWDWEVADDAGGTAFGNLKNGVADIIGMEASPTGKRYSEPEKYLRRGFFRQLVKTLQSQGAKTLKITMQSGDTRKALARLVETGELVNPRGVAGISVDEHPTTFDIPEPSKNVLTDASTPVTGGGMETTTTQRDATKPEQMTPEEVVNREAGIRQFDTGFRVKKTGRLINTGNLHEMPKGMSPSQIEAGFIAKDNGEFLTKAEHHSQFMTFDKVQDAQRRYKEATGRGWDTHKTFIEQAFNSKHPVSAAAIEAYGITLPTGYQKQGDLYVFQPETTQPQTPSQPAQAPAVQAAAQAGVQEARSEDGGMSTTKPRDYATGDPNTPFYFEDDSWKVDQDRLPKGSEVIETSDGPAVYSRQADGSVSAYGVNANGRHTYVGKSNNTFLPSEYAGVPLNEMFSALKGNRTYESDRAGDLFPALDQATAEKLVAKYPPTKRAEATRHPNLTPRARSYLIAVEDGQGRVSTRSEQRAIAEENGFTFKDGDSESFEKALKARAAELAAGPIGPMIDLSEPPPVTGGGMETTTTQPEQESRIKNDNRVGQFQVTLTANKNQVASFQVDSIEDARIEADRITAKRKSEGLPVASATAREIKSKSNRGISYGDEINLSGESTVAKMSDEDRQSQVEMIRDMMATNRENKKPIPQGWINRLAELEGKPKAAPGEIYSEVVEGHPQYPTRFKELEYLIPIKVRAGDDLSNKFNRAQAEYDRLNKIIGTAEYAVRQARTASQKSKAQSNLAKLGKERDMRDILQEQIFPELNRLQKAIEASNATQESTTPEITPETHPQAPQETASQAAPETGVVEARGEEGGGEGVAGIAGSQKRAAVGGEYGPNGEWYPGGAFIATTDMPKKQKEKLHKMSEKAKGVEVRRGVREDIKPGFFSPFRVLVGAAIGPSGNINEEYLSNSSNDFPAGYVEQVRAAVARFNAGENQLPMADFPRLANADSIAVAINAGVAIPGEVMEAHEWAKDFVEKYQPKKKSNEPASSENSLDLASRLESEVGWKRDMHQKQADSDQGGRGIAVGAEHINDRWKAEAISDMVRLAKEGKSLDEATAEARRLARESIKKHNDRRPKDINWKRWEGSADDAIDYVARAWSKIQKNTAVADDSSGVTDINSNPNQADGQPPNHIGIKAWRRLTPRQKRQIIADRQNARKIISEADKYKKARNANKQPAPAPSAPSRESEAGAVATSPPGASPPVVAASDIVPDNGKKASRGTPTTQPRKFSVNPVSDFMAEERQQKAEDAAKLAWKEKQKDRITAQDILSADWEKIINDVDKGRRGMTYPAVRSMVDSAYSEGAIPKAWHEVLLKKLVEPQQEEPSKPPDARTQFVAEFASLFPGLPKVSSLTPQQAAAGIESILNDGKQRPQLEVALLRKTLAMYKDMVAGYGVTASYDPRLNAVVAEPGTSPSTLAHEVGHLIERTLLKSASPETQKAIRDSYERWLKSKDGGNNLTETDRARFWDYMTEEGWANPDAKYEAGDRSKRYITGFKEWFADQVGRWASTNAKPVSLIDKFFKDVATKLKQFFDKIQQRFMPDKTVSDWLDQLSGPAPKPASKPPDAGAPRTIKQGDKVKFKQEGVLQSGTYIGVNPDSTYSVQVKGEKVPRHVSARSLNESNGGMVVEGTRFSLPAAQNANEPSPGGLSEAERSRILESAKQERSRIEKPYRNDPQLPTAFTESEARERLLDDLDREPTREEVETYVRESVDEQDKAVEEALSEARDSINERVAHSIIKETLERLGFKNAGYSNKSEATYWYLPGTEEMGEDFRVRVASHDAVYGISDTRVKIDLRDTIDENDAVDQAIDAKARLLKEIAATREDDGDLTQEQNNPAAQVSGLDTRLRPQVSPQTQPSVNPNLNPTGAEGRALSALPTGNRAMPLDKARAHVYNKIKASPRKVRVINEPSLKFRGRYDPDGTITLNSAYLGSVEELNDVLLNHESIHDAIETSGKVREQADALLGALTDDELADIEAEILDYKDGEFSAEQVQAERQVEAIRKLTANRPDLQSAWGRLVESVSLSFKKLLGVNVSRQQAELAAARIVARGLKRLRKGKTGGRTQGGGSLYYSQDQFFDTGVPDHRDAENLARTPNLPRDTKIPTRSSLSQQDVDRINAAWTSPEASGWFTFGKTDSRSPAKIAEAYSTSESEVTADDYAHMVVFRSGDGKIAINMDSGDGSAILNIMKNGPVTGQLYQAALTYLHNNNLTRKDLGLSERNAGIRLVSNMLSSALRHGTTKHLNSHGIRGITWKRGNDAWNIAQLANYERLYVFRNLQQGEIEKTLASSGLGGTGLIGADAQVLGDTGAGTLAEVLARAARYGVGPKTVARAAVTASAIQGKDGAIREAADRIAVVRPLYQNETREVVNGAIPRANEAGLVGGSKSNAQGSSSKDSGLLSQRDNRQATGKDGAKARERNGGIDTRSESEKKEDASRGGIVQGVRDNRNVSSVRRHDDKGRAGKLEDAGGDDVLAGERLVGKRPASVVPLYSLPKEKGAGDMAGRSPPDAPESSQSQEAKDPTKRTKQRRVFARINGVDLNPPTGTEVVGTENDDGTWDVLLDKDNKPIYIAKSGLYDAETAARVVEASEALVEAIGLENLADALVSPKKLMQYGIVPNSALHQGVAFEVQNQATKLHNDDMENPALQSLYDKALNGRERVGTEVGQSGGIRGALYNHPKYQHLFITESLHDQIKKGIARGIDTIFDAKELATKIQEAVKRAEEAARSDLEDMLGAMNPELSDEVDEPVEIETPAEMDKEEKKANSTAEGIITEAANRLGDPPVETEKQVNLVRELYRRHVENRMGKQEFENEAVALRLNPAVAYRLWNTGNTERTARETITRYKQIEAEKRKDEAADKKARRLIYETMKRMRQSGYNEANKKQADSILKAFNDQVKKPDSLAKFQARLKNLRVSGEAAEALFETAKKEAADRAKMQVFKDRKALLEKDSPVLASLLNRLKGDVSWKEILGDPKLRMRERMAGIWDRVRKHEALQDLSPAEQQQLTVELERLLQKQRLKQVNKDLNEAGLNLPKKAEKAVRDSMPELLRLINLGTFSAETFRDAIAPKFGLKTLSSKEVKRVEEIAAKINDAPAGMPKRQLQDELLKAMQDITSATKSQIALQYWVSSVLSGGRTQFDTALSFLNGTRKFLQGASLAAMKGEGKVVGQAFQRYFNGLHDGMMEAAYYFRTGDPTMLLNFDAEMNAYLKGGQNEAHPYRLSEKIWSDAKKSGNWLKIPPAAVIMSVNRMMQSWDHINARATSRGFLPLAVAYNRKLYSDLKVPDQADYKAAEQQAEQILGKPKTWGEKVKVRAMANEILDASVSEDNKVRDSIINEAIDIGRTASYQNDPAGLIGTLYHGIKNTTANIIRKAEAAAQEASKTAAKTGTKSAKAKAQAMNLVAFSSRFVEPIAGTMFLRFVGNRFNELISLTPGLGAMRLWEKEMNETKKAMIYTDQAVGSLLYALGAVALYAMLGDDDDEDKRGWRIEGGWQGVDRAKQRQMLSEGRTPYSLAFKNKDGSWGTLKYGNWPVASILATVGGMSDKSKYRPKEWNEDSYAAHVANAIFGGITAISDISAISALMETLGGTQYGKDPVEGLRDRVNATMANFAGGFIPRAAKDLDYLSNPAHNKPDDLMSFWLKEIPVYRRSVGAPMMDVFGRQVQLRREPWSRAYLPGPIEPEYQIAGKMASRGLFLPLSDPDQRVVGKGKNRRDMTDEEKGRYVEEVGSLYKDFVIRYGEKVLDMEPDKARDFIASHLSEARNKAEKRAVR